MTSLPVRSPKSASCSRPLHSDLPSPGQVPLAELLPPLSLLAQPARTSPAVTRAAAAAAPGACCVIACVLPFCVSQQVRSVGPHVPGTRSRRGRCKRLRNGSSRRTDNVFVTHVTFRWERSHRTVRRSPGGPASNIVVPRRPRPCPTPPILRPPSRHRQGPSPAAGRPMCPVRAAGGGSAAEQGELLVDVQVVQAGRVELGPQGPLRRERLVGTAKVAQRPGDHPPADPDVLGAAESVRGRRAPARRPSGPRASRRRRRAPSRCWSAGRRPSRGPPGRCCAGRAPARARWSGAARPAPPRARPCGRRRRRARRRRPTSRPVPRPRSALAPRRDGRSSAAAGRAPAPRGPPPGRPRRARRRGARGPRRSAPGARAPARPRSAARPARHLRRGPRPPEPLLGPHRVLEVPQGPQVGHGHIVAIHGPRSEPVRAGQRRSAPRGQAPPQVGLAGQPGGVPVAPGGDHRREERLRRGAGRRRRGDVGAPPRPRAGHRPRRATPGRSAGAGRGTGAPPGRARCAGRDDMSAPAAQCASCRGIGTGGASCSRTRSRTT